MLFYTPVVETFIFDGTFKGIIPCLLSGRCTSKRHNVRNVRILMVCIPPPQRHDGINYFAVRGVASASKDPVA